MPIFAHPVTDAFSYSNFIHNSSFHYLTMPQWKGEYYHFNLSTAIGKSVM